MAALSDVVMHHLEANHIQAEKKVKYWIQILARVFGGKRIRRLGSDQPDPQKRGKPGLEHLLLIGAQARASPKGWKNMDPFKSRTYSTA
jgi:hypothetical protein